ncbi:hypothetical protein OCAR_5439 [Afipia carboxidovorans OM5]|nr:hypothetical protein OCAR_5439 [Afipia carboxidovorans OM5]
MSLQCGVIVADPANRPGAVRSEGVFPGFHSRNCFDHQKGAE